MPDLLLGCGAVYFALFAGLIFAGDQFREVLPLELIPLVVLFTGVPHYGATLLRVYQRREDRQRYAFFGVYATALVWLAFVVGVYEFTVGSLLLTVYLTWSPWHYSGQNYGIAMMFLRRREVEVPQLAQRLLWWSFFLSFVLTALAMHGATADVVYAPGDYQRSAYQVIPLGIPVGVVSVLVPFVFGIYLACVVTALVLFKRSASWRDLLPSGMLLVSQALWFTVPMVTRYAGVFQGVEPLGTQHATYTFFWIAVAHSVQYLWVTTYFARRAPNPPSTSRYFGRVLAAGAAIWVVPGLLFAPSVLGRVTYDTGLAALIAAAVNLHHFILDGAIWKLRDGRLAKILLRGQKSGESGGGGSPILGWSVAAIGTASALVFGLAPLEHRAGSLAGERGDLTRLETSLERMRWLGRESPQSHAALALAYQEAGRPKLAEQQVTLARGYRPDYDTLGSLAVYLMRERRFAEAYTAIQEAHRLRPKSPRVCGLLAQLILICEPGRPERVREAVTIAETAVERAYSESGKANHLRTLAAAYAAAGRMGDALDAAERGLEIAPQPSELRRWFREQVEVYRQAAGRGG